jgi:integrase
MPKKLPTGREAIMALTDMKIKNAKPQDKPYKNADGDGLTLIVTPAGGKWWRFRYRFDGKEKALSFGTYPEISLSTAREKRLEARKQVAAGIDPGVLRKEAKTEKIEFTENTFEKIAREWHDKLIHIWTPGHAVTITSRLERDLFPMIGHRPIKEIKASDILDALRTVESRGAIETAHRIKTICSQVFRYAIATGRAEYDPTLNLKGALQPVVEKHHSAIVEPDKIGGLLRSIDGYQGTFTVMCALKLAPLLFVRPGELRQAEWSEFDFDAAQWTIPAERMKMKISHIVPLSLQAMGILESLKPFTGDGRYVFPSPRTMSRPMSNNAILSALRRMGYEKDEMSGHGFRAMARTILDEVLQFRPDFIEHQLAHAVRDPNGRAYNRTSHLAERAKMMQVWADYLDGLKAGAKVIPLKRAGATV